MAVKTRAQLLTDIAALITTNNNNEITGAQLRGLLIDLADSCLNLTTDGTATPALSAVLAQGAVTGAHDISFSEGQVAKFLFSTFSAVLQTADLDGDRMLTLPNASGTLALTTDIDTAIEKVRRWHQGVISLISTPPVGPMIGDRHLIKTGASGAWTGHVNDIAEWDGASWIFETALAGDGLWSEQVPDQWLIYNGTNWISQLLTPSLGDVMAIDNQTNSDLILTNLAKFTPMDYTHSSAGVLTLQMGLSLHRISASADIEIDYTGAADNAWYLITIENTAGINLALTFTHGKWWKNKSETEDFTAVKTGSSTVFTMLCHWLNGRMCVVTVMQQQISLG